MHHVIILPVLLQADFEQSVYRLHKNGDIEVPNNNTNNGCVRLPKMENLRTHRMWWPAHAVLVLAYRIPINLAAW